MFDQLMDLVRQHSGNAINNNPDIPNNQNEEAVKETTNGIAGGLQSLLAGGGLQQLLRMFTGNDGNASNAVSQQVSGGVIERLMQKFGLSHPQASNVAGNVVPNVLNDMVTKTNDPQDKSFDIQSIFNSLSGGSTSGFNMQSLLNKLKGGKLDLDGDGDTDFQDIMSIFKGGAGGGNLMDKVKGMFN
jgi:predicted lipid-binding transport protein (Tim44 family)